MAKNNIENDPAKALTASWTHILFSKRLVAPALITLILLGAHVSFGILENYEKILLSVAVCFTAELILGRLVLGRWPNPASAYISGNSIGILLRSPMFWPYALCSAITITSKYVLRYKGKHLWNPSNFGVSAMFFLAPFAVTPLSVQWGNNAWPIMAIWIIGAITLWRIKRFHICFAYVVGFFIFAAVRACITGGLYVTEIAPMTGVMYQLFVLFMITDPKTTVQSRSGRMGVAFLVAFVEMFFRLGEVIYAPFYALFLVGPTAMFLEARRDTQNDARRDARDDVRHEVKVDTSSAIEQAA